MSAAAPKQSAPAPATAVERKIERLASPVVQVHYRLKPGGPSLTGVDLYYTRDRGNSWVKAELKGPYESPLQFNAAHDGLYGLYLVFKSPAGATPIPSNGSSAQQWVLVDTTPPLISLRKILPDRRFNLNREIELSWKIEDADPADRPVSIYYRSENSKTYQSIAADLPSTGSTRWTVPDDVSGRIDLKIAARDLAGNRSEYVDDRLRIDADDAEVASHRSAQDDLPLSATGEWEDGDESGGIDNSQASENDAPAFLSEPDSGATIPDTGAAREAKKQYDLATWHRLRGENEIALSKYREAVRLLPGYQAARNDLAALLCQMNLFEEAEAEYLEVLKADGRHRAALKGLAWVQARRRNYRSAHATLEKLLLLDPKDAEAWLNFGDVRLFMGDRPAAREAWNKALALAVQDKDVRVRAEKRLAMYAEGGESAGGVETSASR